MELSCSFWPRFSMDSARSVKFSFVIFSIFHVALLGAHWMSLNQNVVIISMEPHWEIDGKLQFIDCKTSRQFQLQYFWTLAPLLSECHHGPPKHPAIFPTAASYGPTHELCLDEISSCWSTGPSSWVAGVVERLFTEFFQTYIPDPGLISTLHVIS